MHGDLPIEDIHRCARNRDFLAAVANFYRDLDQDIAARDPVCTNRGQCCRFEAFEHNLFVTATELAYFLGTVEGPLLASPTRASCPYQQGGGCTARSSRPAGCRIFFCDPAAADWQPAASEAAIHALAAIGQRFGLPYAYLEWTDALRALGGTESTTKRPGNGVQVRIDINERPS